MMQVATPERVESELRPGDVLAFAGHGLISQVVQAVTGSGISHVGIVMSGGPAPARIIESTSLDGFTGVTDGLFLARIPQYNGQVWWYPLSPENRAKCRPLTFAAWLDEQNGDRYATWEAIECAFQVHHAQHSGEWFCSELVTNALKLAGVLGPHVDPDMTRPCDVVKFPIFADDFYQIGGLA